MKREVGISHLIFHLLKMGCGTPELQGLLEQAVPYSGKRKSWFNTLSGELEMPFNRIKSIFYDLRCVLNADEIIKLYNYLDKRSKRLSQSRLIVVSDKISSVRSNIKHLRHIQGELHDSSIKSIFKPTKGND